MNFNFIINGNSPQYLIYLQQMLSFKEQLPSNSIVNKTYIILNEQISPIDDLNLKSLSMNTTLIIQQEHDIENLIQYLTSNIIKNDEIYIFSHDLAQMGIMERISYRLDASSCSDICKFEFTEQKFYVQKMVYANNLEAVFQLKKYPYFLSLDKTFAKSKNELTALTDIFHNPNITIEKINSSNNMPKCVDISIDKTENKLLSAKIVLIIGFGVHDKELIEKVKNLANKLNAIVAGSRPIIMNALLPMDRLIGVSGNIIQPEICIVLGASGAPAFYSGIEKSKYIISINKDANATIMKKSDLILVDDINNILDIFIEKYS